MPCVVALGAEVWFGSLNRAYVEWGQGIKNVFSSIKTVKVLFVHCTFLSPDFY